MSDIAKNLKQLRLSKNYTQEDVADKIGLTRQAISSYESGRTQPGIDLLMRFAEIYEVELDEILYGKKQEVREHRRIKVIFFVVIALWLSCRIFEIGMLMAADSAYSPTETSVHVDSKELKDAIDLRFEYLERASLFEGMAYKVFGIGGLILLILDLTMKKAFSAKTKWKAAGCVCMLSLVFSLLGGMLVPIYKANLMWPFYFSVANMLVLILIDGLGWKIKDAR